MYIMGTKWNCLGEAISMSPHNREKKNMNNVFYPKYLDRAFSIDPYQIPHIASDLDLHCLSPFQHFLDTSTVTSSPAIFRHINR